MDAHRHPTRLDRFVNRIQGWWASLGLPPRVIAIAPAGRQHFPVAVDAPLSEFASIAEHYPVYRINPAQSSG
ncbi:MAG TPA: hypothetical protein VJV78_17720 [Polyangiales bacterium]|nr:hypothetical protein [Polyangiales bacterium]